MTIGRNFVKAYYQVLSTEPEKIVKFYKPASVFSHGQGSEPTTPTTIAESNDLLKDRLFGCESYQLDLEHGAIDAQMSLGGGVLVVVTGHLVIEEQRRAFCHTFFLNVFSAPDSTRKQYYVHNDVMRFLSDGTKKEAAEEEEVSAEVTQEEIVMEKAEDVPETTEEEPAAAPAEEEPVVEPEIVPEPLVNEETPVYEPVVEPEPAVEETKEDIVEERDSKSKRKGKSRGGRRKSLSPPPKSEDAKAQPAPGSWASMVAHNASAPVPPSPPRRTEKKEKESPPKEEHKPEKPAAEQQQQQGRQQRGQRLRDPDCTLVIKNVPDNTREREVRDLFEPFAIQTKSKILGLNVSGSKGLAFVDYDSPEPVLLALKDKQQFQLQGRNLELEPKMVDKSRAKGAGGRYRGQGGDGGGANGFRGSGRSGQQRRRGSGGGRGDRGGGGKGGRGGR